MLTDEEIQDIKIKLINHIDSTFDEDKKQSAVSQVELMNSQELEVFLEKNNLIKKEASGECVFCSIASGAIRSCKIDENKKAIAVLDINPISKGHTLIIAKTHSDKDQKEVEALGKRISKKIKSKFSPKKIESQRSRLFGHEVINLLPVYIDETMESERKHFSLEDLEQIKEEINRKKERKKKTVEVKSKIEEIKESLWLPKRIP